MSHYHEKAMTQTFLFDRHNDIAMEIAGSKFGDGNGDDGKHYWLTPPDLYAQLDAEFHLIGHANLGELRTYYRERAEDIAARL